MTTAVPPELWQQVARMGGVAAWPPTDRLEMDRLFNFAARQGLFGLLMADAAVPAEIAAARSRFRVREAVDHLRLRRSLESIRLLQGVLGPDRVLLFKGSDYRHRLYAAPHLRQMADVDILVEPGTFDDTLRCLARAGYPREYGADIASHAPLASEASVMVGGVLIDVHRNFFHAVRATVDYAGLWQRRERFEADGLSACRFSAADALLCHAVSPLAVDEFSCPLIRYVDFYLLLQRYPKELAVSIERARQWGVARAMFGAIHVTSTLFPSLRSAVLDAAMRELVAPPTRDMLVRHVLPGANSRSCVPPIMRREQLWRKFWLMDKPWRRAVFLLYHWFELVAGSLNRLRRRGRMGSGLRAAAGRPSGPPVP